MGWVAYYVTVNCNPSLLGQHLEEDPGVVAPRALVQVHVAVDGRLLAGKLLLQLFVALLVAGDDRELLHVVTVSREQTYLKIVNSSRIKTWDHATYTQ